MPFIRMDWTPQEGKIPAFSSRQPFAQALAMGKKTIELKPWATSHRGSIAIHASKKWYGDDGEGYIDPHPIANAIKRMDLPRDTPNYPRGAIVAVAWLVKCATFTKEGYERLRSAHQSDCPWTPGEYGWQFEDVVMLPEPIHNVRGYLGLFGVDVEPLKDVLNLLYAKHNVEVH